MGALMFSFPLILVLFFLYCTFESFTEFLKGMLFIVGGILFFWVCFKIQIVGAHWLGFN
jgi:hypothetical protein